MSPMGEMAAIPPIHNHAISAVREHRHGGIKVSGCHLFRQDTGTCFSEEIGSSDKAMYAPSLPRGDFSAELHETWTRWPPQL